MTPEALSDAQMVQFVRWFFAGMLALNGTLWVAGAWKLAAVCPHGPTRGLDPRDVRRINDAGVRRKALEGVSPAFGIFLGLASIACGVACAAGTGTPAFWYAAVMAATSLAMGGAYLRLRVPAKKRAAILSARKPNAVPAYWFGGAIGVALLAFAASELHGLNWPALLVLEASLASTWIAWQIATMPSLLAGEDVQAERFVDEHVRFGRAAAVLLFAYVEVFVFVALDQGKSGVWQGNAFVAFAATAAWLTFSAWTISRKLRPQHVALS